MTSELSGELASATRVPGCGGGALSAAPIVKFDVLLTSYECVSHSSARDSATPLESCSAAHRLVTKDLSYLQDVARSLQEHRGRAEFGARGDGRDLAIDGFLGPDVLRQAALDAFPRMASLLTAAHDLHGSVAVATASPHATVGTKRRRSAAADKPESTSKSAQRDAAPLAAFALCNPAAASVATRKGGSVSAGWGVLLIGA